MAELGLRNLVKVACEYEGWERYDSGPVAFYLIRVSQVWALFDEDDQPVCQEETKRACLLKFDSELDALLRPKTVVRARRRTTTRPGVAPVIGPRDVDDSNRRVGQWPPGLSGSDIRKLIGPIQLQGDSF